MDIDKRLRGFEKDTASNWQRIIFMLRKHLDVWVHRNIRPSWGQMKISYMPVIFNITIDGTTAIEIARKSMTQKQTVSRTIKELEENGMIVSEVNQNDKRSESLVLTELGKQFVLEANMESAKLMDTYKELVGEKNLSIALDVLNKITAYHEKLDVDDAHLGD